MTLQAGSNGDDVKELQQQLKDGGYYTGPIDGDYGPDTESAVRAYQSAHGLNVDGVAGAETWGNIHGDPNYPNNSAGTMGGGGGSGQPDNVDSFISPQFKYLMSDPEVAKILRDSATAAKSGHPWTQDEFDSQIMNTSWFKTSSDSQRKYFETMHNDPGTFNQQLQVYKDQVQQVGGNLGYDETVLTPGYIDYFANRAFQQNLSASQLKQMMVDEITPLIGTTEKSPVLAQVRNLLTSYGQSFDTPTLNYWLDAIGSGRQTVENLKNTLAGQVKNLYPHFTDQIDSGMTFQQITNPYRQAIAKTMEVDPARVDFNDPRWRHIIDYVDPKTGVHRSMSSVEADSYLKSLPEWNNTKNAVDTYSQIGQQLLQSFGAVR